MTLSRKVTGEEVWEALKHEYGPWVSAVEIAYLSLLRKCRKSLNGEHSVGVLVER